MIDQFQSPASCFPKGEQELGHGYANALVAYTFAEDKNR
jgi:hypothetical protein